MTHTGNSPASRDKAFLLHPYTNLKRHEEVGPLLITHGQGVRVFDDQGRDYIEGLAGLWCAALGFDHPRLAAVAAQQMRTLPFYHAFGHKSHLPGIDLAEALIGMAPTPMARVLFANSGSEANDAAIKLIWYYHNAIGKPEKKTILSRHRAYHGVTVATASLTGLPNNHRDFDLPIAGIRHLDCPSFYREALPGESEEAFSTRLAENLEALILAQGPETIAALFAEPVMGAGGVVVPPAGYFPKIQAILRKYEILLVADEVICGFHRTGNLWGSQTFGLTPDILTTAKQLSSGYLPISATMISEPIYEALVHESEKIGIFGHGYTYAGHPVAAAVALETLKIYQEMDMAGHVQAVMPSFQEGLAALAEHPLVGEARGVGLLGAVELVRDKTTRENYAPSLGIGGRVSALCQEHGLINRAMVHDTLPFCPPLIISAEEIALMFHRFRLALDQALDQLTREGLAPAG